MAQVCNLCPRTGKIPLPPKIFFWFPSSRLGTPLQAKLLLCERIISLLRHAPRAGAWERGKGGMHCAFPPYGLRAFPPYGLLMKRSVGRASPPAVAISSWCVRRTLRKTFGTEIIAGAPSRLSRPDTGLPSTRYPVHHKPGRLRPSMGIAGDCKPPAWIIRRKWRQNLLR